MEKKEFNVEVMMLKPESIALVQKRVMANTHLYSIFGFFLLVLAFKFLLPTGKSAKTTSLAEECFTKNDINFANRPPFLNGKHLHYNFTTVVSANYGDHWRNLRRICAIEIFSLSRLNSSSIGHPKRRNQAISTQTSASFQKRFF
ncbi:hypothetical protein OIU85_003658 [Salix viminalis]|uniref:Cytochrome P450 n=1 Tax=Salix viminalis TaxID=40686 RepID=A0A9Q0T0W2_SALVM|nr:hypothetical protein OIU85_003658 [Salix viminalis]